LFEHRLLTPAREQGKEPHKSHSRGKRSTQ
jgi:hypothetical protein